MIYKNALHWFRRDLRIKDNIGLYNCQKKSANISAIFIYDQNILSSLDDKNDQRVEFLYQSLKDLEGQLREKGISLFTFYGDPKKINFDDDTAYSSGAINWQGQGSSPAGSHWRVLWDEGGTYGGSSGSPVFNNEGLLVGQLSGGSGNCYSGDTEDFYGKFSRAFRLFDK